MVKAICDKITTKHGTIYQTIWISSMESQFFMQKTWQHFNACARTVFAARLCCRPRKINYCLRNSTNYLIFFIKLFLKLYEGKFYQYVSYSFINPNRRRTTFSPITTNPNNSDLSFFYRTTNSSCFPYRRGVVDATSRATINRTCKFSLFKHFLAKKNNCSFLSTELYRINALQN